MYVYTYTHLFICVYAYLVAITKMCPKSKPLLFQKRENTSPFDSKAVVLHFDNPDILASELT